jgi:carboxyl-terminal processing protease
MIMNNIKFSIKLFALLLIGFTSIATIESDHNKYFEISKNIEIFTNLYKEINTYYVDDLDPGKLMRTGVDAMLESLDPYTNYISETEIEGFRYITDGKYNGIGAMIRQIGDYVTITEPYDNCPAQKAGLKAGDRVLEVDGKSAKGKSTDDVSAILKGFPGTEVDLLIKRPGENKNLKITLVRDEVIVPNVPYSGMVSDEVGYVTLTTFTRDAGRNVGEAVKKLKAENPQLKGIIFDLRGNGGGLLTEAVNVSNVFIPKGEMIVTTKGKVADWDRSFKTLNKSIDEQIPLVVLINKGSASASEIVSGVIQDFDRGVLIGQRSYGKGLVQNTRDVGYNSKVKMTTAKYYVPSGRCIQGVSYENGEPIDIPDSLRTAFKTQSGRPVLDGGGVKPDIAVKEHLDIPIIKDLLKKYMIFEYATDYTLKHSEIAAVEDFRFTEFDDFAAFLQKENFQYETQSEKILETLKSTAEKEGLADAFKADLKTIQNTIDTEKKNELYENKEAIISLIEKEIASRYYFQKGRIQIGLRNDEEIQEALAVIKDQTRYNKLLNKQ